MKDTHALDAFRIGQGWDTHALVPGRPLVIGGIEIPCDQGLLGHSDADVLLHAVTDAVLGAAGLGDIGRHFPDSDAAWKGVASRLLLNRAVELAEETGWAISNVDATVIAQAPRLAPHMDLIRTGLAQALGCAISQVNVKAKTAERLGPVGRGESIEAQAICLLHRAS